MEPIDLFSENRTTFQLRATTKQGVIDELIGLLDKDGVLSDRESFRKAVLKREEEFSTGIGMGIAIPHGKSEAVKVTAIAFGRSERGVEFDSLDEQPAHLFFMLAVPEQAGEEQLIALTEISKRLMHEETRNRLNQAGTYEELLEVFR